MPGFTLFWQRLPSAFLTPQTDLSPWAGAWAMFPPPENSILLAMPKKSNPAPRQFKVGDHLLVKLSDGRIVEAEVKAVVCRR